MKLEEETNKGSSSWPFERKCPECGKVFSGTIIESWCYHDKGEILCSWGCQRKREKREEEREAARRTKVAGLRLTPAQKECILRRHILKGKTNDEIMDETGFSRQLINYYRKKVEEEQKGRR